MTIPLVDRAPDERLGLLGIARAADAARLLDDVRDDRVEPNGTRTTAAHDDEKTPPGFTI
jgi:hypothetical protein